MKIGFFKETELPTGFNGNFWRMGTNILPYTETYTTDFTRELDLEVQFYLYKDFDAYLNNKLSVDTVWVKTTIPYELVNNNAFDNIIDKIASIEGGIFFECIAFDLTNPM